MEDEIKKVSVVTIDKSAVDLFYEEWNKVSKQCNDMIEKSILELKKIGVVK